MMNSSTADSIFLRAIEISSPVEREAYLDSVARQDSELRRRVERLLAAHYKAATNFLEQPAAGVANAAQPEKSFQEIDAKILGAGLTRTFGDDASVVVATLGHSVLRSLQEQLGENSPSVLLRGDASDSATAEKVQSTEIPGVRSDSRYQLHGEIARGGMGAIIKGRDMDLGRDLAIKVLLDAHNQKPEYITRFVEEAQICGQLQHPGIVPVYELGQFDDRRPFFSMKLVKGETLSAILSKRKSTQDGVPKLLATFEQICQAMAYAHTKGVIHRDLKPANIMVGAFGEVQVMDWGLSKVLRTGGTADEEKSQQKLRDATVIATRRTTGSDDPDSDVGSATRHGSVMGTPAYMPPEQALGEVDLLDTRADVFGLGAILAEILSGKPPYVAEDATQVFRMASRGKLDDCFTRLEACNADKELIAIAKRALAADIEDRMFDASALSQAITAYLEGVQDRLKNAELARVEAQAISQEERRRKKLYVAVAGLLLLLACGGVVVASLIASQQSLLADQKTQLANEATKRAEEARQNEIVQTKLRETAEAEEVRASALRLVAQSKSVREQSPARSTLLALKAADTTLSRDGTLLPAAFEAVLNSSVAMNGPPFAIGQSSNRSALSPGGRWLVTGSKRLVVWDLWAKERPSPKRELPFEFASRWTTLVLGEFIDEHLLLVTISGIKKLINLEKMELVSTLDTVLEQCVAVAASPDRTRLAVSQVDGKVQIYDLQSMDFSAPLRELYQPGSRLNLLLFSADGRWLAASNKSGSLLQQAKGTDNRISLWDLQSKDNQVVATLEKGAESGYGPRSLSFTPDGRWLAASGNPARVWDLEAEGEVDSPILLSDLEDGAYRVAFTANGKWLATCGRPTTLREMNDQGPAPEVQILRRDSKPLWDMEVSRDSRWLAVSSKQDSTAYLWNLEADNIQESYIGLNGHGKRIGDVTFSRDSQSLFTTSIDATVRHWDLSSNSVTSDRVLHFSQNVKVAEFSHDAKQLVVAGDGKIYLFDFDAGVAIPSAVLDGDRPYFSPHGRWLFASSKNNLRVWDLESLDVEKSQRDFVGHTSPFGPVRAVSPDNSWVATVSARDRTTRLWNLTSANPSKSAILLDTCDGELHGPGARFSPDGKWIVGEYSNAGLLQFWDFQEATSSSSNSPVEPKHTISLKNVLPGELITSMAISPDSKFVFAATSNAGRSIRIDLAAPSKGESFQVLDSGEVLGTSGHAHISPDSKYALTFGAVGKIIKWNFDSSSGPEFSDLGGVGSGVKFIVDNSFQRAMTITKDGLARVWDLADASRPLLKLRHSPAVTGGSISPDGRWVVTAARNNVRIWDLNVNAALDHARKVVGRDLSPEELQQYVSTDERILELGQ